MIKSNNTFERQQARTLFRRTRATLKSTKLNTGVKGNNVNNITEEKGIMPPTQNALQVAHIREKKHYNNSGPADTDHHVNGYHEYCSTRSNR